MLQSVETKGWTKKTAWCVPTVVSFISGMPLIHSHSRAAFIQDKTLDDVSGVYASEAILLLREQGYRSKQISLMDEYSDAPKLSKFMNDRTSYQKCMPMMIQVEGKSDFCHMICSQYGMVADNWTMKPVAVDKFPHKNRFVTGAWVVEKVKE